MNLPDIHITKTVVGGLIIATAAMHMFIIPVVKRALPVVGDVRLESIEKTQQSITIHASGEKKRDCLIIAHQAMIEFDSDDGRYRFRPHYNFKFNDSEEPTLREPGFWERQFFHPWVWELTLDQTSEEVLSVLLLTQHLCTTDGGTSGTIVHSSFGPFAVN